MIGNKKVIGVCLTKIHDICRAEWVNRLHTLSENAGCKMLVFNSFVDFYNGDSFDEGAKSIYGIINYDIVDVLVVVCDSFHNKAIIGDIVTEAKVCGKPVIIVDGTADGCWSVCSDYSDAFKGMMNHVIKEHDVKDIFFIAGNDIPSDKDSITRINCFKEVLEENGIPFDKDKIAYGQYWEGPVRSIVCDLVKDGKKPPQAIFCANDYMAFAACKELKKNGYSVPEDVIVTGFDGVPAAEYFAPQLTTCKEDTEKLAEFIISVVQKAVDEKLTPENLVYSYKPVISESCGCQRISDAAFRETALDLHYAADEMEIHEAFIYARIDHMLEIDDMNSLYSSIADTILENSYVCLNSDFVAATVEYNGKKTMPFADDLIVIPSHMSYSEANITKNMNITEMVPNLEEWANSSASYYLTAIHVGGNVVGYYAVKTANICKKTLKIKRVLKAITIAFNVAINHFNQMKMRLSLETVEMTNSVTKLPNFKGLVRWFGEFASIPENRKKVLSFSVYALPKYTYIQENYGMADAEDAVIFIGEALKIANPSNCFIAHINEDEFVVVNYYDGYDTVSDVIDNATSVFFKVVEGYNSTNGKDYYVEANAGCTVIGSDWEDNLESYIKYANGEMYMNRLKYGVGLAVKEEVSPKGHYRAFDLLVEKNLFAYHFQPIVNAKTGDIFAYEALMRTDSSIGMNPLEVLAAAKEYNRLYDIEKATMFNVMERFEKDKDLFANRKVFINTIPGHFLRPADLEALSEKYGEYLDNVIFELTEQDTVSDEELNTIRALAKENNIAIDDYGTGHSNIVNLMRYAPQLIKIDRFLISDIHKDENKQMFVRTTVEFAKLNNIKVLAEGVETSNELRMVIDFGVDYVQGYYTGRPTAEIVPEIAREIRKEIICANPLFGQDRS